MISTGFAATASAARYVQQLVKHWGHRFPTGYDDGIGQLSFSETIYATLMAREEGIAIELVTPTTDDDRRMREVIERHLDRFAFREAPLSYRWEQAG